jgi:hypothetical protein
MNTRQKLDRMTAQFCVRLGRYGCWSEFLDRIGRLVCPAFLDPLLLPGMVGDLIPLSRPILMGGVSSNQGGVRNPDPAPPPSPHPNGGDPGDPAHSSAECNKMIYHGMHGAPCAYHGGSSDNKFCPAGSVTGMWWRFNIPGLGNVYYVDCCGLAITYKVWCRWAKEQNWCVGQGNSIYTCTITLLFGELKVDGHGFADASKHVLSGPPSP